MRPLMAKLGKQVVACGQEARGLGIKGMTDENCAAGWVQAAVGQSQSG